MGVGVSCPKCKDNFPFCCNNCKSYNIVVYEAPKFIHYFQARTVYYFQCQNCMTEYDYAICPSCSKEIMAQFPFVSGDTEAASNKGCFMATACLDENSHIIKQLYVFRDQFLEKNSLGRLFIRYYYMYSPKLAFSISQRKLLKSLSKFVIVYPAYDASLAIMKILSNHKEN
jgi:hypothetical protein